MNMRSWILCWVFCSLVAVVEAAPLPRLKVSENKRYLVTEDGKPFFWLGDTAWELFHRLDRRDAEAYLKNRAEKGFTVVQAVALAEACGAPAIAARARAEVDAVRRVEKVRRWKDDGDDW